MSFVCSLLWRCRWAGRCEGAILVLFIVMAGSKLIKQRKTAAQSGGVGGQVAVLAVTLIS